MPPRDLLERALHALHPVPSMAPWNLQQLADLLPPDQPLRPAAVLVGLREHSRGTSVLLTRRQDALRHHAGQISFPGGRVDDDEGPLRAALREADEEVGVPASAIEPLGWLDPYATITGFHVYSLVARIDPDAPLRPCADEVAEAFEVPLDFLLDPSSARDVAVEWRGRVRALVEFQWHEHRIWGATAAMLVNLRERLHAAGG
mgnify:CR=1 FL=1